MNDVPDGRYILGFFHPMLDSLGVDAPLREVLVYGGRSVHADLAIPSPSRLREVICGPRRGSDSAAVIVGVVRDAHDGSPVGGAAVRGAWLELSFRRGGLVRRVPHLLSTSAENGWFAMCNVPSGGMITLVANHETDSTDVIEVRIPAEGLLHRELYLGRTTTEVVGDTAPHSDSLAPPPRRIHVGDGRISGSVVALAGGQPLGGALISVVGGPETRANDRGEWTLTNSPIGTRMLEVRAVGYYPERRLVDVIPGTRPVRVALATLKAVLDTVRITAGRVRGRDLTAFNARRHTGLGHYLTAEDVARRGAFVTSDLFRNLPGVRFERATFGESEMLIRGPFGWCRPAFYLDGIYLNIGPDDVDTWVRPNEIAGVEVYTGDMVPIEFQRGLSGCGSIVIWTK